jgi:hypothetical protein
VQLYILKPAANFFFFFIKKEILYFIVTHCGKINYSFGAGGTVAALLIGCHCTPIFVAGRGYRNFEHIKDLL